MSAVPAPMFPPLLPPRFVSPMTTFLAAVLAVFLAAGLALLLASTPLVVSGSTQHVVPAGVAAPPRG